LTVNQKQNNNTKTQMLLPTSDLALHRLFRLLAETGDDDGHGGTGESHSEFGVHITYEDLYSTVIFFACIYVCGQIASTVLRMPSLVGEIFCGILLGPPLGTFFCFCCYAACFVVKSCRFSNTKDFLHHTISEIAINIPCGM
jgi:hypothetical protein